MRPGPVRRAEAVHGAAPNGAGRVAEKWRGGTARCRRRAVPHGRGPRHRDVPVWPRGPSTMLAPRPGPQRSFLALSRARSWPSPPDSSPFLNFKNSNGVQTENGSSAQGFGQKSVCSGTENVRSPLRAWGEVVFVPTDAMQNGCRRGPKSFCSQPKRDGVQTENGSSAQSFDQTSACWGTEHFRLPLGASGEVAFLPTDAIENGSRRRPKRFCSQPTRDRVLAAIGESV